MKRNVRKAIFLTTILMPLFFIGTQIVSAQHGYRVTKRLTFRKGEISTTLRGTIPNTLEAHEYVIRARKGQTLHIRLSAPRKDVSFAVMDMDGNWIDADNDLRTWTNELAEPGDYKIIISTRLKGAARYTLDIQIATDI
jgi:hypothetical protein